MSIYISLFTVGIPVNYTSEFRERFGAIKYMYHGRTQLLENMD